MKTDPERGLLTKGGWIPRLVVVGVAASIISGCQSEFVGEVSATSTSGHHEQQGELLGKVALESNKPVD